MTMIPEELCVFFSQNPYYRCALLVAGNVVRLRDEAEHLAATRSWPMVSLGRALAEQLLPFAPSRRPRQVSRALGDILVPYAPGPVALVDCDLLFEPPLEVDPLAVLREASRTVGLVVAWPGTYVEGVLAYAEPAHAHYRTWQDVEVLVCALGLED